MRSFVSRIVLLSLPVMIVLGFTEEVRAQRGYGIGVGVGVGGGYGPYYGRPGFGPYWGPGWGAGWAYQPNYYGGTWGNGLSMYGPPVPTGKPVAGMFGGGDSQFFPLPRLYPGWVYEVYVPVQPAPLPEGVIAPDGALPKPAEVLPAPAPMLEKPAAMDIEVRLPEKDAKVFIDGAETKSTGDVRIFASPVHERAETLSYDVRAEWKVDGLMTTHTRRVTGRAGEKVVVEFSR
jgi:uncharacterized protein (TIGR03000 family)